ncbi:MAG: hypothetical protein RLO12_10910 [Fulvivirga sp.]
MAKKKNFRDIRAKQSAAIDTLDIYASNSESAEKEKEEKVAEKSEVVQEKKPVPKEPVKKQVEKIEDKPVLQKPLEQPVATQKVDRRKAEDPKRPFSTLVKHSVQNEMNEVLDKYRQAINYQYTKTDLVEEGLLKQIAALKRKLKEQEESK